MLSNVCLKMETKEFVLQWLREHQGFQQEEVSKEDMAHFVGILTDICDAMKQKTIEEAKEF